MTVSTKCTLQTCKLDCYRAIADSQRSTECSVLAAGLLKAAVVVVFPEVIAFYRLNYWRRSYFVYLCGPIAVDFITRQRSKSLSASGRCVAFCRLRRSAARRLLSKTSNAHTSNVARIACGQISAGATSVALWGTGARAPF